MTAHDFARSIRTQTAVIRMLLDEIEHHSGLTHARAGLCEQAEEEVLRLETLLGGMRSTEPSA